MYFLSGYWMAWIQANKSVDHGRIIIIVLLVLVKDLQYLKWGQSRLGKVTASALWSGWRNDSGARLDVAIAESRPSE